MRNENLLNFVENKISKLEEKIENVEAGLIEQEHRPITLIWNYIKRKSKWQEGDKRREAASKAIIWRLLFSPSTFVIASGGLLAFFTIFFMHNQNELIEDQIKLFENQNKLFEIQNKHAEKQTHLIETSRRSSQMFIMGDVLSDVNTELKDTMNIRDTLSTTLVGRIISLSRAMKPYRYLDGDSLIKKSISPERGQLLITLLKSKIDRNYFLNEILHGSDFSYADLSASNLSNVDLNHAKLMRANLSGANLFEANFVRADLGEADLSGANLVHANLSEANLNEAKLMRTDLVGADLSSARLSWADLSGAHLISTDLSYADLSGANLSGANLSGANLSGTHLSGANLESVFLYKAKIDRHDWLIYIKDSLKLSGSEEIYNAYRVDSVSYNRWTKKKGLMLITK